MNPLDVMLAWVVRPSWTAVPRSGMAHPANTTAPTAPADMPISLAAHAR